MCSMNMEQIVRVVKQLLNSEVDLILMQQCSEIEIIWVYGFYAFLHMCICRTHYGRAVSISSSVRTLSICLLVLHWSNRLELNLEG